MIDEDRRKKEASNVIQTTKQSNTTYTCRKLAQSTLKISVVVNKLQLPSTFASLRYQNCYQTDWKNVKYIENHERTITLLLHISSAHDDDRTCTTMCIGPQELIEVAHVIQ